MEVSNFSTLCFKPKLHRPCSFSQVMLETRERTHLTRSYIDPCAVLPHHRSVYAHKRLNTVSGRNSGVRANFLHVLPLSNFKASSGSRSLISCHVTKEESGEALTGESILLNEQTLERELQVAIKEENYMQAAKLRDSLRLLQEDSKASVLAANARFYNFFRNGDLAAMQALWSKGEHVCVVHPGVSGISGHDLVMGSWEFVWADYEFPLEIKIKDAQVQVRGDMGYVTCIEMVKTKGGNSWGRHFATNAFEKVGGQWLICIHHASYVDL